MSTLTVGWIIDVVEKKIIDEGNADFSESELVGLYNLSLRLIVSLVPRAYALTQSVLLTAGTFQSIPSNGIKLLDITRNTGAAGTSNGSNVTPVDPVSMRQMVPSWSNETAAAEIQHFMRIPDMDASFHVYPPSDGTGYVEMVFSACPPTVVYDSGDVWKSSRIPLSDEFVPAIPDAIMFHAYDDDTDIPGNAQRSQLHYQRVLSLLGLKSPEMKSQAAAAAKGGA